MTIFPKIVHANKSPAIFFQTFFYFCLFACTKLVWATSALNPEIGAVPFLPTNPHLSATRNQGRQKLARFSPNEFAGLLTDVLVDAKRRQNMAALRPLGKVF